ncbi:MAG: hypothetical protein HY711_06870 [Candidatus Melainabacteria bacterium]|nr:hypothetical protein [Candidatus Melainabacteria bacterium]
MVDVSKETQEARNTETQQESTARKASEKMVQEVYPAPPTSGQATDYPVSRTGSDTATNTSASNVDRAVTPLRDTQQATDQARPAPPAQDVGVNRSSPTGESSSTDTAQRSSPSANDVDRAVIPLRDTQQATDQARPAQEVRGAGAAAAGADTSYKGEAAQGQAMSRGQPSSQSQDRPVDAPQEIKDSARTAQEVGQSPNTAPERIPPVPTEPQRPPTDTGRTPPPTTEVGNRVPVGSERPRTGDGSDGSTNTSRPGGGTPTSASRGPEPPVGAPPEGGPTRGQGVQPTEAPPGRTSPTVQRPEAPTQAIDRSRQEPTTTRPGESHAPPPRSEASGDVPKSRTPNTTEGEIKNTSPQARSLTSDTETNPRKRQEEPTSPPKEHGSSPAPRKETADSPQSHRIAGPAADNLLRESKAEPMRPTSHSSGGGLEKTAIGKDHITGPVQPLTKPLKDLEHTDKKPTELSGPTTRPSREGTPEKSTILHIAPSANLHRVASQMEDRHLSFTLRASKEAALSTQKFEMLGVAKARTPKDTTVGVFKDSTAGKVIETAGAGTQKLPTGRPQDATGPVKDTHTSSAGKPTADAPGSAAKPGKVQDTAGTSGQPVRVSPETQGQGLQPGRTAPVMNPGAIEPGRTTTDGGATRIPTKSVADIIATTKPDKREFTGAEIILATVIAAAGAARVRPDAVRDLSTKEPVPQKDQVIQQTEQPDSVKPSDAPQGVKQPVQPNDQIAQYTEETKSGKTSETREGVIASPHIEVMAKTDLEEESESKEETMESEEANDTSSQIAPQTVLLRPTHIVAHNDTLVSIAEQLFHDPNISWLIADLNKDAIKESWDSDKRIVELRERQQIQLPVWQDIVGFNQERLAKSTPENLVTIVTETQIDRDLLDSNLGVVMGQSSASVTPFERQATSASSSTQQPDKPGHAAIEIPPINWGMDAIENFVGRLSKTVSNIGKHPKHKESPADHPNV